MGTLKKGLFLVGDILVFYAALATMIIVRYQNPSTLGLGFLVHFPPFTSILLIWGLAFYWNNLYEYRSFGNRAWLFRALFRSIVIGTMGSIMAFYLFPKFFEFTPRANLFLFAGIFLIFSYFWRMLALHFSKSGALNVIIIGDSPLTDDVAKYIEENKNSDYKIVEWIKIPTKEKLDSLAEIIHLKNAELVVMQHSISKDFSAVRSVYKLLPLEISVVSFSDFYESIFEKAPLKELEENWFIENISTRRPAYDMIKRAEDIFGALLVGAIFILPALLIAVLIRLSSKGPVIYTQDRTGKNGKKFTIYKFRTMRTNTGGPAWTEKNDSRITKVGALLRYTHLDELPQIINILKNDISFVGPRPESTELSAQYEKFPYYDIRHVIKPGLTGWAQVCFRPSASFEEAYEKLCYDVYYIKNRSLFLDFLIFVRTVKYLFTSYTK
ncbi:MAG: sugar transferase [Candidatus Jorgensenbacteria bacterium]|nr:sugar transferase [Candidatus Jorgensenbacteria bacterium]